jgi:adenylate cyclase
VIDAVECAISIQETLGKLSADVEAARRMLYRIGINLGNVMYDESRIY